MKKQLWIALLFSLAALVTTAMPVFAEKMTLKDKAFLKKTANCGMMEVQAGQLAQEKAQSQEVKDFGKRMVTDHGKANEELKALAQKKGQTLPAEMGKKYKSMTDKLANTSGAEFDKKYMEMMVKDHMKEVKSFQEAPEKLKDPDLKSWAAKTLPTLEQHLQQSKTIAQKLGLDVEKMTKKGIGSKLKSTLK